MDDINTIAENKLDAMEAEEANKGAENQENEEQINNEGEGEKDGLSEGDEEQSQDDEEEKDGDSEEEQDESEEEKSGDDESEEDEEKQGLSDDELMAELEKRGLKVAKKEEEEKEKPAEIRKPKELTDDTWGDMNEVQRTIYSSLPYINIRGKDSEGNELSLSIKTPEQLPEDFEFLSKRDEASFISDITAQSKRAEEAYAKIAGKTEQTKAQEAQVEESRRVVADVERLQKENIIPKIKAKAGTEEFNNDPSVKLVNEVLNFWAELNKGGENVSVYTAAKLFKSENPDKFKDSTKSEGDKERKNISSKIKGSSKGKGKGDGDNRPRFPVGTTASDIADYYSKDLD